MKKATRFRAALALFIDAIRLSSALPELVPIRGKQIA